MRTLLSLFALIFVVGISSCSDDDSDVNMQDLLRFKYKHGTAILMDGTTAVVVDSVVYQFINLDSLVVAHAYFGDRSQMSLPEKDTAYFTPIISGNSMYFKPSEDFALYPSDYLTNFQWEVVSVSASELKLKLHSSSFPTTSAVLKSVPK